MRAVRVITRAPRTFSSTGARRFHTSRRVQQQQTSRAAVGTSRATFSATNAFIAGVAGVSLSAAAVALLQQPARAEEDVDYAALRKDIERLMASNPAYDDGSYGPLLIRLAWHAAGSYDKHSKTGGSTGGTMRFKEEASHGGNAGLHVARDLLEPLKRRYPNISYADLWSFAGTVAIEILGGPKAKWRPGRKDESRASHTPTPDGRLPDASQGADHLRDIFYRMGFTDREIVALSGAHVLGRCHRDRSGFDGPWSNNPTFFSNDYFILLQDETWTVRSWSGPKQYEDSNKKLMMLPSDIALLEDPAFAQWVRLYAEDEEAFFQDFAKAWTKLQEVGVDFPDKPVWTKLFG